LDAAQQSLWSVVRSRKVSESTSAFRKLGATLVVQGTMQRVGQDLHLSARGAKLRRIGLAELEDRSGNLDIPAGR
jgi:hypothetical protein